MPDVEGRQIGMSLVYQQRGKKDCGDGQQHWRDQIAQPNCYRGALTPNSAALLRLSVCPANCTVATHRNLW
jgi:hypothetical protein